MTTGVAELFLLPEEIGEKAEYNHGNNDDQFRWGLR